MRIYVLTSRVRKWELSMDRGATEKARQTQARGIVTHLMTVQYWVEQTPWLQVRFSLGTPRTYVSSDRQQSYARLSILEALRPYPTVMPRANTSK